MLLAKDESSTKISSCWRAASSSKRGTSASCEKLPEPKLLTYGVYSASIDSRFSWLALAVRTNTCPPDSHLLTVQPAFRVSNSKLFFRSTFSNSSPRAMNKWYTTSASKHIFTASQARHDCADRHIQDLRNLLVGIRFQIKTNFCFRCLRAQNPKAYSQKSRKSSHLAANYPSSKKLRA